MIKEVEYLVLHIAKHSETLETIVVYQALYGDFGIWVRPASMWNETVEQDESNPKFDFAYTQFMNILEPTVEDLANSFMFLGGEDKEISFGRVQKLVDKELQIK